MVDKNLKKQIDALFHQNCKKHFLDPLKEYNFKKYKTSNIARITAGNILQFLNFQKDSYGGNTFTINIAVRPLYIPHEHLSLRPGQRISGFEYNFDKWWSFENERDAYKSFLETSNIFFKKVLPWFDSMSTSELIIKCYENKKYNIPWGTSCWLEFDLAHIYMKIKRYDKAITLLQKSRDCFIIDYREWAQNQAKRCNEILSIIKRNIEDIDEYLTENENISKENLLLTNWEYLLS